MLEHVITFIAEKLNKKIDEYFGAEAGTSLPYS